VNKDCDTKSVLNLASYAPGSACSKCMNKCQNVECPMICAMANPPVGSACAWIAVNIRIQPDALENAYKLVGLVPKNKNEIYLYFLFRNK